MSAFAQAGYSQTKKITATPRQIEAQIFSQIAAALELAAGEDGKAKDVKAMANALHRNSQLWSALMTDLASEGNELPDDLKANLISLGGFSLRHGARVLAGEAQVTDLVDLNRTIASGLRSAAAEAA